MDNTYQQFYHAQDISYAVFSDKLILFSSGKFNYELSFDGDWLGNPDLYRVGFVAEGYIHIAQEDQNSRIAIVSSLQPSNMYVLSNFSFLLVLGLGIILIFLLFQGITNYIQGEKLYFSARIQLLLNLAFFLPLILVSVTTLNLTSRSSQNQLNEEYPGSRLPMTSLTRGRVLWIVANTCAATPGHQRIQLVARMLAVRFPERHDEIAVATVLGEARIIGFVTEPQVVRRIS